MVLRGAILSTPVFHKMPSHATLIPVPGDDRQLDALCAAINTQFPPLTEQQQRKVKKKLAVYPVHPRATELEQRFLPELRQGKTIHLKSGFRSIPYTRPDSRSLFHPGPLSGRNPDRPGGYPVRGTGAGRHDYLPTVAPCMGKMHAFMDAALREPWPWRLSFRGRFTRCSRSETACRMWGIPVITFIQPISVIYILTPEEERRMHREFLYHVFRDMLFQSARGSLKTAFLSVRWANRSLFND
ncbi:MAG: hypothetical protein ACLT8E_08720 [Akkermansia sp.]